MHGNELQNSLPHGICLCVCVCVCVCVRARAYAAIYNTVNINNLCLKKHRLFLLAAKQPVKQLTFHLINVSQKTGVRKSPYNRILRNLLMDQKCSAVMHSRQIESNQNPSSLSSLTSTFALVSQVISFFQFSHHPFLLYDIEVLNSKD